MRCLTKGEKPMILVENERGWTQEYLSATAAGRKKLRRYAHPEIKSALDTETGGKCAYCESRMHGITWHHVEHLLPKARYPELVVAWENLTLACPVCNNEKRDYANPVAPLATPYEPSEIIFAGSLPLPNNASRMAKRTINRLKLDRTELMTERERRLKEVNKSLEEWILASEGDREWIAAGIRIDARDGEFTTCVESFLRFRNFPL